MNCSIHATAPNILQEAKPGDLFLVHAAGENECVFALLDPAAPLRSQFSNEVTLIKTVAIACRVDEGEPGFHAAGTALMLAPDTAITFVEQTGPAAFRQRAAKAGEPLKSKLTLKQQVAAILGAFDPLAVMAAGETVLITQKLRAS
jgi:hypothetical protein